MKNTLKTIAVAAVTFVSATFLPVSDSLALPSGGAYICDNSVPYYVYFENGEIKKVRVPGKCEGTVFLDW